MSRKRQPAIYLPHGGGPCFFMDPPEEDPTRWVAMRAYLASLPALLPARPDALLVISAHWEMPRPTVLAAAHPGMLYDYSNFPPHTYQIQFPAPGNPELAARVRQLLTEAGIESDAECQRGYDHGIFVPLKVSFPTADVPIVQLSLQRGLDAATHLRIGAALSSLRDDNVTVIGSGLSFHNLAALSDPRMNQPAVEFDRWLTHTLCDLPPADRNRNLEKWSAAPYARICHPREEHLLPLMVAAGAAGVDTGHCLFNGSIWGKPVSAYHFN